jgi:hypothetical protein
LPVLLCDLEGRTHAEAARELGCPVNTVSTRLTRARARLRDRLARRGVGVGAGVLAAAHSFPSPRAVGASPAAVVLAEGVIRDMAHTPIRFAAAVALVLVGAAGLGLLARPANSDEAAGGGAALAQAPADSSPVLFEGRYFVVCPVRTELQRSSIRDFKPRVSVVVLLDGTALVSGTLLEGNEVHFDQLHKVFSAAYPNRRAETVLFHPHFAPTDRHPERLADWALKMYGRHAGFGRAEVTTTWHNGEFRWEDLTAAVKAKTAGRPEGDEPASGDERVTVYPVRTTLSRFLCSNADCVIDLRAPIPDQGRPLPPEYEKSLREQVGRLKLPAGGKVLYRVRFEGPARRSLIDTLRPVTPALGFAGYTVQGNLEPCAARGRSV